MTGLPFMRQVAGAALAAFAAASGAFAASLPPCGACAHITENEYPHLEETCEWFRMGGLQVVRADIEWNRMQRKPDAPIVFDSIDQDYTSLDLVLTTCERYGIQLLPVFNRIPDWAKPIDEHLDALAAFVRAFVERYGRRCPTVEFLNEVNLSKEYTGTNLVRYVRALRTVYETVKSVDPNIRVSFSGLAGEGADYLKEAYAAGAGRWFDVYSCHPYSNPLPPDTATHVRLDERLERLRAVMAANGDAKKPILVTELGWSTQTGGSDVVTEGNQANFLARGLGICFAEGVESVLAYEFRSPEGDPYYSECHYGLVHDNFAPKPAFSAYRTFSRLRPPGSVQLPGDWRDAGRIDYFPRWTRPDGREAGMFWTTGTDREKTVSFGGRRVRFYNTTGRIVKMPSPDGKSFVIPLSGEPVYYLCTEGVPPTESRPKEPSAIVRLPDAMHARATRRMLCAPSLAASRSGRRLWASWFAGVTDFEDSNNYVVLATSVDGGVTWREVLAVDPDGEGPRRCFDPQLWTTPDGQLHWTWIDRRAVLRDGMDMRRGGDRWGMSGGAHPYGDQTWMLSFDAEREPPADLPAPIYVGLGLEACKPAALSTGEWLLPLYVNHGRPPSANFYATRDHRTFTFLPGISIPKEKQGFEEHTLVERRNGDLWCLLRADGGLQEAISRDKGRTWSEARPPAVLKHTSSRLFLRRLASGNLLLVKHGKPNEDAGRTNLSAFISEDDGVTWKGGLLLDERLHASYPDGDQLPDGTILVVYDHDRSRRGTVHLAQFTEADVLAGRDVSGKLRRRGLITRNPSWREP